LAVGRGHGTASALVHLENPEKHRTTLDSL